MDKKYILETISETDDGKETTGFTIKNSPTVQFYLDLPKTILYLISLYQFSITTGSVYLDKNGMTVTEETNGKKLPDITEFLVYKLADDDAQKKAVKSLIDARNEPPDKSPKVGSLNESTNKVEQKSIASKIDTTVKAKLSEKEANEYVSTIHKKADKTIPTTAEETKGKFEEMFYNDKAEEGKVFSITKDINDSAIISKTSMEVAEKALTMSKMFSGAALSINSVNMLSTATKGEVSHSVQALIAGMKNELRNFSTMQTNLTIAEHFVLNKTSKSIIDTLNLCYLKAPPELAYMQEVRDDEVQIHAPFIGIEMIDDQLQRTMGIKNLKRIVDLAFFDPSISPIDLDDPRTFKACLTSMASVFNPDTLLTKLRVTNISVTDVMQFMWFVSSNISKKFLLRDCESIDIYHLGISQECTIIQRMKAAHLVNQGKLKGVHLFDAAYPTTDTTYNAIHTIVYPPTSTIYLGDESHVGGTVSHKYSIPTTMMSSSLAKTVALASVRAIHNTSAQYNEIQELFNRFIPDAAFMEHSEFKITYTAPMIANDNLDAELDTIHPVPLTRFGYAAIFRDFIANPNTRARVRAFSMDMLSELYKQALLTGSTSQNTSGLSTLQIVVRNDTNLDVFCSMVDAMASSFNFSTLARIHVYNNHASMIRLKPIMIQSKPTNYYMVMSEIVGMFVMAARAPRLMKTNMIRCYGAFSKLVSMLCPREYAKACPNGWAITANGTFLASQTLNSFHPEVGMRFLFFDRQLLETVLKGQKSKEKILFNLIVEFMAKILRESRFTYSIPESDYTPVSTSHESVFRFNIRIAYGTDTNFGGNHFFVLGVNEIVNAGHAWLSERGSTSHFVYNSLANTGQQAFIDYIRYLMIQFVALSECTEGIHRAAHAFDIVPMDSTFSGGEIDDAFFVCSVDANAKIQTPFVVLDVIDPASIGLTPWMQFASIGPFAHPSGCMLGGSVHHGFALQHSVDSDFIQRMIENLSPNLARRFLAYAPSIVYESYTDACRRDLVAGILMSNDNFASDLPIVDTMVRIWKSSSATKAKDFVNLLKLFNVTVWDNEIFRDIQGFDATIANNLADPRYARYTIGIGASTTTDISISAPQMRNVIEFKDEYISTVLREVLLATVEKLDYQIGLSFSMLRHTSAGIMTHPRMRFGAGRNFMKSLGLRAEIGGISRQTSLMKLNSTTRLTTVHYSFRFLNLMTLQDNYITDGSTANGESPSKMFGSFPVRKEKHGTVEGWWYREVVTFSTLDGVSDYWAHITLIVKAGWARTVEHEMVDFIQRCTFAGVMNVEMVNLPIIPYISYISETEATIGVFDEEHKAIFLEASSKAVTAYVLVPIPVIRDKLKDVDMRSFCLPICPYEDPHYTHIMNITQIETSRPPECLTNYEEELIITDPEAADSINLSKDSYQSGFESRQSFRVYKTPMGLDDELVKNYPLVDFRTTTMPPTYDISYLLGSDV